MEPIAAALTAPLQETDAYKLGHIMMNPTGTEFIQSNYTNRGSRVPGVDHVVHFGLQAFLQSYCIEAFADFFAADEDAVAEEYQEFLNSVLGPNSIGVDHIRALHRLGYLPLFFRAVPEGTRVPLRVPSLIVENTHPDFYWLVNYIETILSAELWLPSTSATTADRYRQILDKAAADQGGDARAVDFQMHDFSFRGMSGKAAAAMSGAAHLLSFLGSDSLVSMEYVRRYYGTDAQRPVLASVPATEHSVMCEGIAIEGEQETFSRLMDAFPSGILSVVSDTYDLWNVLTSILPSLHEQIMGRDGKLVIRPDSGDPADIICGTRTKPGAIHDSRLKLRNSDPAYFGVVQLLWETFGGTVNEAGLKVLDPHVGVIYGDSITPERAQDIIERLATAGFAASNVVFGVGSFTYQFVTRDTYGSAVKATWAQIGGKGYNLKKDPITDSGLKTSATGRLAVHRVDGELVLIEQATPEQEAASELVPIWKDGEFLLRDDFGTIRDRLGNLA